MKALLFTIVLFAGFSAEAGVRFCDGVNKPTQGSYEADLRQVVEGLNPRSCGDSVDIHTELLRYFYQLREYRPAIDFYTAFNSRDAMVNGVSDFIAALDIDHKVKAEHYWPEDEIADFSDDSFYNRGVRATHAMMTLEILAMNAILRGVVNLNNGHAQPNLRFSPNTREFYRLGLYEDDFKKLSNVLDNLKGQFDRLSPELTRSFQLSVGTASGSLAARYNAILSEMSRLESQYRPLPRPPVVIQNCVKPWDPIQMRAHRWKALCVDDLLAAYPGESSSLVRAVRARLRSRTNINGQYGGYTVYLNGTNGNNPSYFDNDLKGSC